MDKPPAYAPAYSDDYRDAASVICKLLRDRWCSLDNERRENISDCYKRNSTAHGVAWAISEIEKEFSLDQK